MFEQTTWSPCLTNVEMAVIAAMPEAKAFAPAPPFENRQVLFQARARRILRPAVLEALVLPEPLLDVRRSLVDRKETEPVAGSGALPAWMQSVLKPISSFLALQGM